MYISNGIIYGSEHTELLKIKSVKPLDNMIMIIIFTNNEIKLFDASILKGEVFVPLKDESVFNNPVIDHGVVTWNDGDIDCAPEFMYENSYKYNFVKVFERAAGYSEL